MRAVRGEVVPRRIERGPVGVVLDDHLGVRELVRAFAVVALRIASHLPLAGRAERDLLPHDLGLYVARVRGPDRDRGRLRRDQEQGRDQEDRHAPHAAA
jgi:hypothetical protein